MSNIRAAAGVCAACKHDPQCIWEGFSGRVVLQCEQFELGFREQERIPIPAGPRDVSSDAQATNGYAGLCSNCDNREACIYPKPEGGVWRCEEYV